MSEAESQLIFPAHLFPMLSVLMSAIIAGVCMYIYSRLSKKCGSKLLVRVSITMWLAIISVFCNLVYVFMYRSCKSNYVQPYQILPIEIFGIAMDIGIVAGILSMEAYKNQCDEKEDAFMRRTMYVLRILMVLPGIHFLFSLIVIYYKYRDDPKSLVKQKELSEKIKKNIADLEKGIQDAQELSRIKKGNEDLIEKQEELREMKKKLDKGEEIPKPPPIQAPVEAPIPPPIQAPVQAPKPRQQLLQKADTYAIMPPSQAISTELVKGKGVTFTETPNRIPKKQLEARSLFKPAGVKGAHYASTDPSIMRRSIKRKLDKAYDIGLKLITDGDEAELK